MSIGFMCAGLGVPLGWLIFGVATLRARVFPRVATAVLTVSALLALLPLPLITNAAWLVVYASWVG